MLRHWGTLTRTIPWLILGVIALALAMVQGDPSPGRRRVALVLAGVVALSAGYGVVEHVLANMNAGPLDVRYQTRWEGMSLPAQLWVAFSGAVGPAPALAPAVLAFAGALVCLLAVTAPPLTDGEQRRGVRRPIC